MQLHRLRWRKYLPLEVGAELHRKTENLLMKMVMKKRVVMVILMVRKPKKNLQ